MMIFRRGNELKELVALGREGTTVILDEVDRNNFCNYVWFLNV